MSTFTMALDGWGAYWTVSSESAAHGPGRLQAQALAEFWGGVFRDALAPRADARVMDIGCGGGVVLRALRDAAVRHRTTRLTLLGLDRSHAAVTRLIAEVPEVCGIVGNAASLPFADRSFDLVTSQFGIEYGGADAVSEAARLVSRGGRLACVMHLNGGAIYQECAANLEAVRVTLDRGLFRLARESFAQLNGSPAKTGGPDSFVESAEFSHALHATRELLQRAGPGVAAGAIQQLCDDLEYISRRPSAYEASELLQWIDALGTEFELYEQRMKAMLDSSLTEIALERMIGGLFDKGFTARTKQTMSMGPNLQPAAWGVILERAA